MRRWGVLGMMILMGAAACGESSKGGPGAAGATGGAAGNAGATTAGGAGAAMAGSVGAATAGNASAVGGDGASGGADGLSGGAGGAGPGSSGGPADAGDSGGGASGEGGGGSQSLCVTSDVFDPDEVYLQGTLQEGLCGADAIAHWSCPDAAATGFPCSSPGPGQLRADGRLLYGNFSQGTVREFHCDACPFQGDVADYPEQTDANDPSLVPACSTSTFFLSPDGVLVYRCQGDWYELGGTGHAANTYSILHLGYGKRALTTTGILDLDTGENKTLTGLPFYLDHVGYRAKAPDKFWVAAVTAQGTSLFEVNAEGVATLLGDYPPIPQGFSAGGEGALESNGALLQFGDGPAVFQDVVVRRTIQGESSVVFDEADDPLVKLHISYLVTGP